MLVYIAAAAMYFILTSLLSKKHSATADNYYTGVRTAETSHGAWHMDCICSENVMQVLQELMLPEWSHWAFSLSFINVKQAQQLWLN